MGPFAHQVTTTKGLPYYVTASHYKLKDKPNQVEIENSVDEHYEKMFTGCMKREGTPIDVFRDRSKPLQQFCLELVSFEININGMTEDEIERSHDAMMYELRDKTSTM